MLVVEDFGGDYRWIVDSGASFHMTRIWRVFLIITNIDPHQLVESEGGMAQAYMNLEGLYSDLSMEDSWSLMDFSFFQG
jgi:hypothetical protein